MLLKILLSSVLSAWAGLPNALPPSAPLLSAGVKDKEAEFMQYLLPVGRGPSSKMCPSLPLNFLFLLPLSNLPPHIHPRKAVSGVFVDRVWIITSRGIRTKQQVGVTDLRAAGFHPVHPVGKVVCECDCVRTDHVVE
ncbi:hypothetical protein CB1_000151001 [Camelus ferus]|nr:hypothetical protein CB1_000151001 [Camelus ferus]